MTSSPTLSKPIVQDEDRPAYGEASEKKKTSNSEWKETANTLKDEQKELINSIEEEDKKINALKLEVEQFKLIILNCGSDPATLYAALCSGPPV